MGNRAERPSPAAAPLDEISKRIIEQLQEDGRRPYAAIGKAVGLSEAAVRQRVQRLLESGVMQIVAVTDPLQVGFHRQAMIGVRVEGDMTTVADRLAELSEVSYVVVTAGSFDLLAEVISEFVPAGVLNVITGDRETGRALVEHPTPQMVAITGSVRAGMEVAKSASTDVKRVQS